jgi:hypothetical protein
MSRTPWFAYKIPPIVERENPSDVYALGWDHDLADSYDGDPTATNPTQFLKWKKVEASGGCVGLALYIKPFTSGVPPVTVKQVWIGAGTIAGQLPSGFNPIEGIFIASSGSGAVWAQININETTGQIISTSVNSGASRPQNTSTNFYYSLGSYAYNGSNPTVINFGCGSLNATICRNWFAANPPFYGVNFTR